MAASRLIVVSKTIAVKESPLEIVGRSPLNRRADTNLIIAVWENPRLLLRALGSAIKAVLLPAANSCLSVLERRGTVGPLLGGFREPSPELDFLYDFLVAFLGA
jgi:hypothetical protein